MSGPSVTDHLMTIMMPRLLTRNRKGKQIREPNRVIGRPSIASDSLPTLEGEERGPCKPTRVRQMASGQCAPGCAEMAATRWSSRLTRGEYNQVQE